MFDKCYLIKLKSIGLRKHTAILCLILVDLKALSCHPLIQLKYKVSYSNPNSIFNRNFNNTEDILTILIRFNDFNQVVWFKVLLFLKF